MNLTLLFCWMGKRSDKPVTRTSSRTQRRLQCCLHTKFANAHMMRHEGGNHIWQHPYDEVTTLLTTIANNYVMRLLGYSPNLPASIWWGLVRWRQMESSSWSSSRCELERRCPPVQSWSKNRSNIIGQISCLIWTSCHKQIIGHLSWIKNSDW